MSRGAGRQRAAGNRARGGQGNRGRGAAGKRGTRKEHREGEAEGHSGREGERQRGRGAQRQRGRGRARQRGRGAEGSLTLARRGQAAWGSLRAGRGVAPEGSAVLHWGGGGAEAGGPSVMLTSLTHQPSASFPSGAGEAARAALADVRGRAEIRSRLGFCHAPLATSEGLLEWARGEAFKREG